MTLKTKRENESQAQKQGFKLANRTRTNAREFSQPPSQGFSSSRPGEGKGRGPGNEVAHIISFLMGNRKIFILVLPNIGP